MKTKTFDCVEMKREIQERILKEFAGLSEEQQRELTEMQINADPILGPIWQRGRATRTSRTAFKP